jgi:RND superfamily putative drug exporter
LAPALLRALGAAVFWPLGIPRPKDETVASDDSDQTAAAPGRFFWLWDRVARLIVAYPGWILSVCTLILLCPAYHGLSAGRNVTYDFLRQLPDDRPSKQGAELMARHFPVGEGGPLTVVVRKPDGTFDTKEGREEVRTLNDQLYVDGVTQVRSIADPLGDFPPDARVGLFRPEAWRQRAASHPRSMEIFVATQGEFAGGVTRLDLILDCDPFSTRAEEVLERVEQKLNSIKGDPDSPWHETTFAFAGIAASIRDLKLVTQSDNRRIQILVVLAVLAVLLVILRRPLVCIYMIATVLFSYFVTIGVTEWFFAWSYGSAYQGLDWKVPLFLFVILVAIGQDYNVYLATRVFEEQARRGLLPGLHHAVVRTGGIITSCGVIMAGTFVSMTSGTWTPTISKWFPAVGDFLGTQAGALPAIVQLGFALALGVMLDTFIVRPILVPAFLALLARFRVEKTDHA